MNCIPFEEKHRIQETVLNLLDERAVATLTEAAKLVGTHRQTLRRWADESPGFGRRLAVAIENSREARVDEVEESHFEAAVGKGNVLAQIHILKHRRKAYAEPTRRLSDQPINVYIDRAQINLAGESTEEMRWLEAAGDRGRSSGSVELEAGEADAWAVRQ